MQAVIPSIASVAKRYEILSALACICSMLTLSAGSLAHAQPTVATTVSATAQTTRDNERLRVLNDELKKSEGLLETLAKRRAERLAAGDHSAADEADESRIRALSDIAGIKREIAAAQVAVAPPKATPASSNAPQPIRVKQVEVSSAAPWWDVYSKPPRTTAAASAASRSDPPRSTTAAQTSPSSRME